MNPAIFITASDTDAGKTFVTAALTRLLRQHGVQVGALKPVASGVDESGSNGDITTLLAAQGLPRNQPDCINLYRFAQPAAPLFADTHHQLNRQRLAEWCRQRAEQFDVTLIEGVGGLMTPLAAGFDVCDWLHDLPECPLLLVVRVRLGGINHALLTLEKLRAMGRLPRFVVLNDADNSGEAMMAMHDAAIAPRLPAATVITRLPFGAEPDRLATLLNPLVGALGGLR